MPVLRQLGEVLPAPHCDAKLHPSFILHFESRHYSTVYTGILHVTSQTTTRTVQWKA